MAVEVQYASVDYAGNGSTSTPYPVIFPAFAARDVYCSVKLDGEEDFVTLDDADYTVTELDDGTFEVTTATAYTADDTIRLIRLMEMDQPFEFPEGGRFPSREVERALDRIVMLMQQLRVEAGLFGSTFFPAIGSAMASFTYAADDAERALLRPAYAGQKLVQLDSGQIYSGLSNDVGDWDEYGD